MQIRDLVQRGNTLQFNCNVGNRIYEVSPEFSISGFTFHIMAINVKDVTNNVLILVRFFKNCLEDDLTYSITISSNKLSIAAKRFLSDYNYHLIKEDNQERVFDISVVMDTVHVSSFKALHDDTELTDFELRGEDGSVKVHKAVLAASSDVLRRMLSGYWRETTEGHLDVPGTSTQTLQHLKDYIYLRKLPYTGLEQILLLASYYMIPGLEQKCVNELMNRLTAQDTFDLLEFAVKHKITRLVLAILDCVQSRWVKVTDIRKHFLNY
ncbi:unnamed protein product [Parnassius mnemosyne]|uniref:BTB domain-containing protein n=1 Tax=Parnassius mnemosyne TaxID=213953 RepID=A0AAV1KP36_9NEOP